MEAICSEATGLHSAAWRLAPDLHLFTTAAWTAGPHLFPPDRSVSLSAIVFMVLLQKAALEKNIMNTTIAVTKDVTTLVNVLTVEPENQQKLIQLLRDNTENVVSGLNGWISTSFIAATDQRHVVIYSQWRDLASVEAMRTNPNMTAYFPRIAALAAFDSLAGEVVYNRHA